MKPVYFALALLFLASFPASAQVPLYAEDFSDNIGIVPNRYVHIPSSPVRPRWAVAGEPIGMSNANGKLGFLGANEPCSWVSESIGVAGYSSLSLSVDLSETGDFDGTDYLEVYVVEDGVQRLVSTQSANDFESLNITEPCTASVSLQVLLYVQSSQGPYWSDYVFIDDVTVTGTADFTDIDADGINDDVDVCLDLDGDGTCDDVDETILLMDEDFSSHSIGPVIGSTTTDEAGKAHVEGLAQAGGVGWALMGEAQRNDVEIRASAGKQYMRFSYTGSSSADTTGITLMSRNFDLTRITSPKVRFVLSETSDFTETNSDGKFTIYFVEDGVERKAMEFEGEFTAVDSTVATLAEESLMILVRTYAMREAELALEQMSVFGGFCQTGKDANGNCQDIGCTDERACNYNSIAITHDPAQCAFIGDACDDGVSTNFNDRYINAGDGTCGCTGYGLQAIYLEDFSDYGAAQGGLGYGYEGSSDISDAGINTNNAALETEWTLTFGNPEVGTGNAFTPMPAYFATQEESGDTLMRAFNTDGDFMRWTTRTIDVSSFDSLYVSGSLLGQYNAQAAADYAKVVWLDNGVAQTPALDQIVGQSMSTSTFIEKLTVPSGSLKVQVEIETNTTGFNTAASYSFDDIVVTGLKRGCSDPDASNYVAAPADGHVALSDDGSCQYDWDVVYSRKDGEFGDVIWAGKPCSEAGYTCGSSTQTIDAHAVTENGTRHAVLSANTIVTVPASGYTLGELTLESGAELIIPDGVTLTVQGDVHHQGGTVSGTGRLVVEGEMELADGITEVTVHDFTFGLDANLNLAEGVILKIEGDLVIEDGSAISGKMELVGNSAQTVSGSDVRFDDLRVASSGVTFLNDAAVTGLLDLDQGVVDLNGNTLTFESSAEGTGMLDVVSANASLQSAGGLVHSIVERYIAPDTDGTTTGGYSLYSSPLTGAKVGDLNEIPGFYLTGFAGTDWPNAICSVLFWDETKAEFIEPTSLNTPLDTLGGCWVAISGSQNPTLSSEGTLRLHNESAPDHSESLTRTSGSVYAGWNLVVNPYQAPVDWDAIHAASTNLQDQYAVYSAQSRSFVRYGDGFDSADRLIMPGQAFWVAVDSVPGQMTSTGTLTIPTTAISVTGDLPEFIRTEEEGLWEAELIVEIENSFGSDRAILDFGSMGSLNALAGHDLSHLSSSSVKSGQLAVQCGVNHYVRKGLPLDGVAPLLVKSRANVETTMRVVSFTEGAEVCVTITDTETGEMIVSRVGDEMTFTLPAHQAAEGRFVLEVVPSAQVFARPPSCPGLEDGRVEVAVGEGPANVLLTDGGDNVLDQYLGATGSAVFQYLVPGDYGLVVAGPEMRCGTERRSFTVEPGVEPELFGLEFTVPSCNQGEADIAFEIYGHGDFNTSLRLDNETVWSGVEPGGEVLLAGLDPGTYALEVDHICLEETVVLDLMDPEAVYAEADYSPMVVLDPVGGSALEALSTCVGEENYRWTLDGEEVGENEPLFHIVDQTGGHVVELEAWNETCSDVVELPFLVVNWNEARVMEAPVTVREDAGQWVLEFGQDLGWTQLRMMDASGRTVWSGSAYVDAGYLHRVDRPATAGTYLMQVIGNGGQWGFPLLSAGF